MNQRLFLFRCLLIMPGIALLVTSTMLLSASVFGMPRFTLGLGMHLVGQACCLSALCLPAWWPIRLRVPSEPVPHDKTLPSASYMVRPASFRLSVQAMRLLGGVGVTILAAACLLVGTLQLRNLLRLRAQGVTTSATITGTSFREAGPLLTVTYTFPTPHGLPVTATFRAPRRLLAEMQTGNTLPVTYLPANPDVYSLQPVDNVLIIQRLLAGMVLFLTAAAYIGLPLTVIERRLRRQLRLARVGVVVTGTIVACRPLGGRKRRRGYLLAYTFALPSGHLYRGQALVPHVAGEPTLPGFPLTVLHDPIQPAIHLPLAAFHAVQIAQARTTVLAL